MKEVYTSKLDQILDNDMIPENLKEGNQVLILENKDINEIENFQKTDGIW